jgi:hypothetical protein
MDQNETVVKEKEIIHDGGGSGTGVIAGILIAILVILLAYLAYDRGLFGNRKEAPEDDTNSVIEVNLGDSGSNGDSGTNGGSY